jgi:uncharacterized membrane protein
MPQDSRVDSERMDTIIGNLLRTGVGLAAALVFTGGVIYLFRHGAETPGYAVFRGEPADLRTLTGILHDVQSLRGRGIIQLGLLVLIATPVARVAFLAYIFARQRDRLYTAVALSVLALLAYSLFGQ